MFYRCTIVTPDNFALLLILNFELAMGLKNLAPPKSFLCFVALLFTKRFGFEEMSTMMWLFGWL